MRVVLGVCVLLAGGCCSPMRVADWPELSVDPAADHSYYVLTRKPGEPVEVRRFPITGNETVLDAASQVNGLSCVVHIWVSRPVPGKVGGSQTLPVDWVAITQRGSTETNFQLLPGDQVFIEQSKTESKGGRVLGSAGSGSTIHDCQGSRSYNHPQDTPTF